MILKNWKKKYLEKTRDNYSVIEIPRIPALFQKEKKSEMVSFFMFDKFHITGTIYI